MMNLDKALHGMQPEVVAKLLAQVEARWTESRIASLRNQTDSTEAFGEMSKSCSKVAKAIIDGSEGDKDRVVEYMQDVCSRSSDTKKQCDSFSAGIEGVMTNDEQLNRNELDLGKFCAAYWEGEVTTVAQTKVQKLNEEEADRAKQEEEARKAKEAEEAKRAADEAAAHEEADLAEAEKLGQEAQEDDKAFTADQKTAEANIAAAEQKANSLVDQARNALQVAGEKEAKAAEAKAEAPVEANNTSDEAAAIAAGDAEAEKIADKAEAKAEEPAAAAAPVDDEKAAEAAGDALAEKIAEKAEAKVEQPVKTLADDKLALPSEPKSAAMLIKKSKFNPPPKKNSTKAKEPVAAKKAAAPKKVEAPKKAAAPKKVEAPKKAEAPKKVESAKKK